MTNRGTRRDLLALSGEGLFSHALVAQSQEDTSTYHRDFGYLISLMLTGAAPSKLPEAERHAILEILRETTKYFK